MRNKDNFFKRAKEKENELNEQLRNTEKVGGKDVFAMILSAFLVIFPVAIIIIAVLSFLVLWLFGAI